jgi:DNA/RNA endonuclease YhcR with UshA esterase domain
MKKYIFIMTMLLSSGLVYAQERISTDRASQYQGETVEVCGLVTQTKDFSKGTYLNIDGRFPNQALTYVVWSSAHSSIKEKFGPINGLKGKQLCAVGKVKNYKGSLQISINSASSLSLQ